jgi:hypothetical protein
MNDTNSVAPEQRSVHERALDGFRGQADRPVMLNAIRSSYVEYQIGALLPGWDHVGDWYGWDFQRGVTRLEAKASAARQTWPQPGPSRPTFDIAARSGHFVGNDWTEAPGRQANVYVFAWHGEYDEAVCDQRDESQWEYYVVRSDDLPPGQKSMSLSSLRNLTEPVSAQALAAAVDEAVIH